MHQTRITWLQQSQIKQIQNQTNIEKQAQVVQE